MSKMSKLKKQVDYAKEKISGEVKEAAGKVTGNQQLELKGKIQAGKADLKKNLNVKDKVNDIKESIAENINNKIDKKKKAGGK